MLDFFKKKKKAKTDKKPQRKGIPTADEQPRIASTVTRRGSRGPSRLLLLPNEVLVVDLWTIPHSRRSPTGGPSTKTRRRRLADSTTLFLAPYASSRS